MQKAYMEWNPQLAVDHHGQPSQYFFPPSRCRSIRICRSRSTTNGTTFMAVRMRRRLIANKWDYYVRDIFDAFYPGYWDMYPSLNGATE